jgi:CheY-like chemotaxis protein
MQEKTMNEHLAAAVAAREVNDIAQCIAHGANAHLLDDSLCFKAIDKGHYDVLSILLDHHANPNGVDGGLVDKAIRKHDLKAVKLLVLMGANLRHEKRDYLRTCKKASAVPIWRYLYQQGLDPQPLGWVYFAGVMGPADMLVSKLTTKDNKQYVAHVLAYQKGVSPIVE